MLGAMTAPALPVRRATRADLPRMAEVLAASFSDDPAFVHMLPPGVRRRADRLRRFFALELPRSLAQGGAWTTSDGSAAAVWYPPGQWKPSVWHTLRQTPGILRALGRQTSLGGQILATMQEHHPRDPHWYLLYLGTEAARQGQGLGTALLQPVLQTCDEQRLPAYLEATDPRNAALYRRHGFRDGEPLPLPADGPVLLPMWREPAARTPGEDAPR